MTEHCFFDIVQRLEQLYVNICDPRRIIMVDGVARPNEHAFGEAWKLQVVCAMPPGRESGRRVMRTILDDSEWQYFNGLPASDAALTRYWPEVIAVIGQSNANDFMQAISDFASDMLSYLTAVERFAKLCEDLEQNPIRVVRVSKGRTWTRDGSSSVQMKSVRLLDAMRSPLENRAEHIAMRLSTIGEAIDNQARHYSPSMPPSYWEKVFPCSWKTIRRRIERGEIRAINVNKKSWRLHKDDLPAKIRTTAASGQILDK